MPKVVMVVVKVMITILTVEMPTTMVVVNPLAMAPAEVAVASKIPSTDNNRPTVALLPVEIDLTSTNREVQVVANPEEDQVLMIRLSSLEI